MASRKATSCRVLIFVYLVLTAPIGGQLLAESQAGSAAEVRVGIVLGNAPAGVDEPSDQQKARSLKGYELYRDGTVNKLMVTGGFTRGYISEARMMKIALVTFGVPQEDVLEDEMAATTIENGVFSSKLFEAEGWHKKIWLVSQQYHLPRAKGVFERNGFAVETVACRDTVPDFEAYSAVPDMTADPGLNADASDFLVVYEPYRSSEPMPWPTPGLARRLRLAAALYHSKIAPKIILINDWYTRGPVDLAQMMKIALMSLGVPAADLRVVQRGEYRGLAGLADVLKEHSTTVLTARGAERTYDPDKAPKWKTIRID